MSEQYNISKETEKLLMGSVYMHESRAITMLESEAMKIKSYILETKQILKNSIGIGIRDFIGEKFDAEKFKIIISVDYDHMLFSVSIGNKSTHKLHGFIRVKMYEWGRWDVESSEAFNISCDDDEIGFYLALSFSAIVTEIYNNNKFFFQKTFYDNYMQFKTDYIAIRKKLRELQ